MVRHWRLALASIWVATLVMVAGIALVVSGGPSSAGPRRVVVQPAPAAAAASRPDDALVPLSTDETTTPTTTPATTVPPTTAAPTTVATTPAPAISVAPRVTQAPAVRTAAAAPAPVKSTPAAVGGAATDFTLIGYRWNPCHVITVTTSGPDISGIVSELASITGLHFQMVSGVAEITVQWGAVPPGGEIGLTAWKAVGGWLNTVGIVISPDAKPYLATVLRHELGHSLGLGHASHSNEIMYPYAGSGSPTDYQAGDLAALRSVGASAGGC